MSQSPRQITLDEWDARYADLVRGGMDEPSYGGPLRRHLQDGDFRLSHLRFDNSAAALRLWNFLLTEEDRLREARADGKMIVGTMKDLGTVPVMAYSLPDVVAFYPDGAWWIPCVMEFSAGLFEMADSLGIDDSFCPVRAILGAFETNAHFPLPDMLVCSVGATCDDFSAIAQRLESLGHPILWWEAPHRRDPEPGEAAIELPGGVQAPASQVEFVKSELARIRDAVEEVSDYRLDDERLAEGIRQANRVRRTLAELRELVYTTTPCPIPSLEMLVAEMFAIHYCSDRAESLEVLDGLLTEAWRRATQNIGVLDDDAVRVFWVNPVADLRAMNILEECGGRVCGTDYMFCHAISEIPEDVPPLDALARIALADPMVGTAGDRARKVCADVKMFGAEAVIVSRIPGASHCATEGAVIRDIVRSEVGIPVLEIEVPTVCDPILPTLRTRLEALVETVKERRQK
jgi:benzoyl-CoA reductase/2-hydroxyglutaryl-CoA dehydratase subunit BcrC/BadD/HgdB